MTRRTRLLSFPVALASALTGLCFVGGPATAPTAATTCRSYLLVLSAMPLELDPLLARATIDPAPPVELDDRPFVTGTLEGNAVVMGLTGIGPENAHATTTAAFAHYQCGGVSQISGVVFSGTAGGDFIGDVFVPSRWTEDGTAFERSDPAMLAVAEQAAPDARLWRTTPTGDPACACVAPDGVRTPVTVEHVPTVTVGGDGLTTDPFGGRTLPCAPAGSDVLGCVPCREMNSDQLAQATALAEGAVPFADPGFFTGYLHSSTPPGTYVTSDEETAVVAAVAAAGHVPFIGFRAASDGPTNTPGTGGDPLMLPGFPAQFVVYRQLAADNAAAAALAFLARWASAA